MARKRVTLAVILLLVLFAAGCPQPPKQPVVEKPPEKPLLYVLLTGSDQNKVMDYTKSLLGNLEIRVDSTLQTREGSDILLPNYEHTLNTVFIPQEQEK